MGLHLRDLTSDDACSPGAALVTFYYKERNQ